MSQRSEIAGRILDHMGDHVGTTLTSQGAYDAVGEYADASAVDHALAELEAEGMTLRMEEDSFDSDDAPVPGWVLTQAGLEETGAEL